MYTPPRLQMDGDAYALRLRALARVRKLLRLAEDQEGLPEGNAARARADAILAEHGMKRGQVDLGEDAFGHRSFELGASSPWRRSLVHAIADYFDCVALYEKGAGEAQTFGPEHMLPHVEYTFVVYMNQLRRRWKEHVEGLKADSSWDKLFPRQQVDAREAFATSFVIGVQERLEADRKRERQEDPSTWSTMAERRRELDKWMRTVGVRWRGGVAGSAAFDAAGYQAGYDADVDAALGQRVVKRITG